MILSSHNSLPQSTAAKGAAATLWCLICNNAASNSLICISGGTISCLFIWLTMYMRCQSAWRLKQVLRQQLIKKSWCALHTISQELIGCVIQPCLQFLGEASPHCCNKQYMSFASPAWWPLFYHPSSSSCHVLQTLLFIEVRLITGDVMCRNQFFCLTTV